MDTRKGLQVGTLHNPITYVQGASPPLYPALPQSLLELTNYFMHKVSPGSMWMLKPYTFIQKNMIKICCMKKSHKTLKLCHTDYALIVLFLLSEQHGVTTIYILLRVQ